MCLCVFSFAESIVCVICFSFRMSAFFMNVSGRMKPYLYAWYELLCGLLRCRVFRARLSAVTPTYGSLSVWSGIYERKRSDALFSPQCGTAIRDRCCCGRTTVFSPIAHPKEKHVSKMRRLPPSYCFKVHSPDGEYPAKAASSVCQQSREIGLWSQPI